MQIKKLFVGLFLGFGLIVPGISVTATTMFFNVYDDYIELVRKFYDFRIIKKNKILIIGLILGIVLTVVFINNLYKNEPFLLNGIFLGILLVCILNEIVILRRTSTFSFLDLFKGMLLVLMINLLLLFLNIKSTNILTISLAGIFSSLAFIIPGVSGGLILMSFNLYYYFIDSLINISKLNIDDTFNLIVYVISLLLFVIINSRIIKIKSRTYFTLGLMISSIYLMLCDHLVIMNSIYNIYDYIIGIIVGVMLSKFFK